MLKKKEKRTANLRLPNSKVPKTRGQKRRNPNENDKSSSLSLERNKE